MRLQLVMTALLGLASSAAAQTQEQRNVMNHVAQVLVVSNGCPSLKPRMLLMSMLLNQSGIDLDRSPYREFVKERGEHYTRAMSRHRPEVICSTGRLLYGRNGQNVANLLED